MGNQYIASVGCIVCGKRTTNGRLRCRACQAIYESTYQKGTNEHDIAILARAARVLHLSYGQGVARHGERELLIRAGMIPE